MVKSKDILVTGDIVIDCIEEVIQPQKKNNAENWKNFPVIKETKIPAGAFLLSEMIEAATGKKTNSPELLADAVSFTPEQIVYRNIEAKKQKKCYESSLQGYSGPLKSIPECLAATNSIVKYPVTAKNAKMVVINDMANGFLSEKTKLIKTIEPDAIIVYKMHHPLVKGPFWKSLINIDADRMVVVVRANDIRRMSGVNISYSLSWERTAKDFVWQINNNTALKTLKECSHLVVLFDTDGAIIHRGNELYNETLIFDPNNLEGQFSAGCPATMPGMLTSFVATLASELDASGMGGLENGVNRGLQTMRKLLSIGFQNNSGIIEYPVAKLFEGDFNSPYVDISIPLPGIQTTADPDFWRILDQRTQNTRKKVASNIVRFGLDKGLPDVPLGVFGKFKTVDRTEIESYSGIKNIINEFLNDPKPSRPLCIAVFGAPGSGKSFGVTEVAKSISAGVLEKLVFNVSQFQGLPDLISAFHRVRNVVLSGKVPFVFFDEFDSSLNGELGWLKYFLAPMQDGCFMEGETNHPLGKAIFVFAGGTSHSFEQFTRENDDAHKKECFASAKGPDFVSRLRGFINILGTNPVSDKDNTCIIRRAIVFRIMLELSDKVKKLFSSDKELNIDEGVMRAFLNIPRYKHGTRSMGAIIDMSTLSGSKQYNQASLPPEHQMNLHVDSRTFLFLTGKESFTCHPDSEEKVIETLAAAMHLKGQKYKQEEAAEAYNYQAFVADIPAKLKVIDCGTRLIDDKRCPLTPDITDEEVETLARLEYERSCREKISSGLQIEKPVDYIKLPEERKQYFRALIESIPLLLKTCKFEVYRMREFDQINDELMIRALALIIHNSYCQERIKDGDTVESNPSIAPFDQLPSDIHNSNIDNARAIPVKLMHIGYRIRKLKDGCKPVLPEFTDEEIEQMAEIEHNRWNWQKRLQGWSYKAGKKNIKNKTNPSLRPWNQLSDKIKQYDRDAVKLIPELLAKANFEIYKVQE